MLEFIFDQAKGRLHVKYTGFWTEAESRSSLDEFKTYTKNVVAKYGTFTLLDDMSQWVPQQAAVVESNTGFGYICMELPIVRNAIIIPSALIRRQVIRTVQAEQCGIYEEYAAADAWLGEVEPVHGMPAARR